MVFYVPICRYILFPTYSVLCGSTNIFVHGRRRTVYVSIAAVAVSSWSLRYICAVLQFSAVAELQRTVA